MSGTAKTAIVTGANAGIGYWTSKVLAQRGWYVIMTGRNSQKLEHAANTIKQSITNDKGGEVTVRLGDYADFGSVRNLAAELKAEPKIDVLINNVGISISKHEVTKDGNDMMLQVNHLSHFLLTNLLLDKLKQSAPARIINVSSRLHRLARGYGFDDFQMERSFGLLDAYGRTKLYSLLFTYELSRRLTGTNATANALHPGIVHTDIGDFDGILSILWPLTKVLQRPKSWGSRVPVFLATSPEVEGVTGKYFSTALREVTPTRLAQNDQAAQRLWDMSTKLVGL